MITLYFQALPEKYRNELLHVKILEALENAKFQDRFDWIRETSFTGTVFDSKNPVDRAPIDGTDAARKKLPSLFVHTGQIGPLTPVTAGAASANATFPSQHNIISEHNRSLFQVRVIAEIVDHGQLGGHWILPDPEALKPSIILSRDELALKGTPKPDVWQGDKPPDVAARHREAARRMQDRYDCFISSL